MTIGETPARVGILRRPVFESSWPALCREAWQRDDVWNQQVQFVLSALRQAMKQGWYDALADLLRHFKSDGAAAVLVDVGNNSGGDDSGDIAARLFSAKPLHSASLWMSQDQTASGAYFDEQFAALHRALDFDAAGTEENKETIRRAFATLTLDKEKLTESCLMSWVWHERRAWNSGSCWRFRAAESAAGPPGYLAANAIANVGVARRLHWPALVAPMWGEWTGPLYVLTNNRTCSSAEMFWRCFAKQPRGKDNRRPHRRRRLRIHE